MQQRDIYPVYNTEHIAVGIYTTQSNVLQPMYSNENTRSNVLQPMYNNEITRSNVLLSFGLRTTQRPMDNWDFEVVYSP